MSGEGLFRGAVIVVRGPVLIGLEQSIYDLVGAFETARPSAQQLLSRRLPWPVAVESLRNEVTGIAVVELGPTESLTDLQRGGTSQNLDPHDQVLEVFIDLLQLGIAVEDSGISFAGLFGEETEIRCDKNLQVRLSASQGTLGQVNETASNCVGLLNNHASSRNDGSALLALIDELLDLLPQHRLKEQVAERLSSLTQTDPIRMMQEAGAELRKMRSPEVVLSVEERARHQPFARLIVDDVANSVSEPGRDLHDLAKNQIEWESDIDSLRGPERQIQLDWAREKHDQKAPFAEDFRKEPFEVGLLGATKIDPVLSTFIGGRRREVVARALDGRLGDGVFDPLVRHMVELELSDQQPPRFGHQWGSWDPERGSFPLKISVTWPEDRQVRSALIEKRTGRATESWTLNRQLDKPSATVGDLVSPRRDITYRVGWRANLPGSQITAAWSNEVALPAPAVPGRFRRYLIELRGPSDLDHAFDDEETFERRQKRSRATRRRSAKGLAALLALMAQAVATWVSVALWIRLLPTLIELIRCF